MAIEDLTAQLTMLKEYGAPDLQLSESTCDEYVGLIDVYREVLTKARASILEIGDLGSPGGYGSAQATKAQLEVNVYGTDGIVAILDNCIEYLDEYEYTVSAACNRLQSAG